jgi:predicted transcriptional regulator
MSLLEIWPTKARRSDVQIMAEILTVSRKAEVRKTEISSTVNISYTQTQRYLKRLEDLKLVEVKIKENNHVSYQTNEKGQQLLNQVESIQQLLQRHNRLNVLR